MYSRERMNGAPPRWNRVEVTEFHLRHAYRKFRGFKKMTTNKTRRSAPHNATASQTQISTRKTRPPFGWRLRQHQPHLFICLEWKRPEGRPGGNFLSIGVTASQAWSRERQLGTSPGFHDFLFFSLLPTPGISRVPVAHRLQSYAQGHPGSRVSVETRIGFRRRHGRNRRGP